MWWVDDCIEHTATREFVCSHLLPDEIARLDRPLGFGDGLTDGTYWEWINEKAKKIFLILVDLGVPDQIFGIIDDSWDDEDLPIALEHVERLALTPTKNERAERKFYARQFHYLLRPLEKGDHIVYGDREIVPIDSVDGTPSSANNSNSSSGGSGSDRVMLPSYPGLVFHRRRIPLAQMPGSAYGAGYVTADDFQYEVGAIRHLQNEHLVSYWASYVQQGFGYVLFTPCSDGSLKSLLATTPACVKSLAKKDRRQLVFNWIHCLVDTLCFLHGRGLSHGNIKPSTVLFNNDNHIFFSDFTHLGTEMAAGSRSAADKTSFDKESYDYAAPEQWYRPSGGRMSGSSVYSGAAAAAAAMSTSPDLYSNSASSSFSISRSLGEYSSSMGGGSSAASAALMAPNPQLNPQAADIFSLGCIILELVGFMLKRTTRAFATHRAAKHKTPGRGGAVLDSSFHKNLGQLESWMAGLVREAASKRKDKKDDPTFDGVAPLLHVAERMLSLHASERPLAYDVQARLYQILRDHCGIAEPHCVHQYSGWDAYSSTGLSQLKLSASYPSMATMMSPTSPKASPMAAFHMPTAASTGSRRPHHTQQGHSQRTGRHVRAGSGSGRSVASVHSVRSSGASGSSRSSGDAAASAANDFIDGLKAFRSLQIRDKVRQPWNKAPVYAA